MNLPALSIADLQQKLRAREVSPAEVLDALDARITAVDSRIHGYLSRDLVAAKEMAAAADVSLPLGFFVAQRMRYGPANAADVFVVNRAFIVSMMLLSGADERVDARRIHIVRNQLLYDPHVVAIALPK